MQNSHDLPSATKTKYRAPVKIPAINVVHLKSRCVDNRSLRSWFRIRDRIQAQQPEFTFVVPTS
jgi:hypothetical protein